MLDMDMAALGQMRSTAMMHIGHDKRLRMRYWGQKRSALSLLQINCCVTRTDHPAQLTDRPLRDIGQTYQHFKPTTWDMLDSTPDPHTRESP